MSDEDLMAAAGDLGARASVGGKTFNAAGIAGAKPRRPEPAQSPGDRMLAELLARKSGAPEEPAVRAADLEPLVQALVTGMDGVVKRMDIGMARAQRPAAVAAAPQVNVAAPQVSVAAPAITFPRPTGWQFEFQRDAAGRITGMTATPLEN